MKTFTNVILEELLEELRATYSSPLIKFSSVCALGVCRIGMLALRLGKYDYTGQVTAFLTLAPEQFQFDDGYMVPYEHPQAVELVVEHFWVVLKAAKRC